MGLPTIRKPLPGKVIFTGTKTIKPEKLVGINRILSVDGQAHLPEHLEHVSRTNPSVIRGIEKRCRRVEDPRAAYERFCRENPLARISPEKFTAIYTNLAASDYGLVEIAKRFRSDVATVKKVNSLGVRTEKEADDIRRRGIGKATSFESSEKGRAKIAHIVELARTTGLSEMDIANKVGVQPVVVAKYVKKSRARSPAKRKEIAKQAVSEKMTIVPKSQLIDLFGQKKVIDGKEQTALSLTEIQEATGLSRTRVKVLAKKAGRTIEENKAAKARMMSERTRSPLKKFLVELYGKELLGSSDIIRRAQEFDKAQGKTRSYQSLLSLMHTAKGEAGIVGRIPTTTKQRVEEAKRKFRSALSQIKAKGQQSNVKALLAITKGVVPEPFAREMFAEHLFRNNFKKEQVVRIAGITEERALAVMKIASVPLEGQRYKPLGFRRESDDRELASERKNRPWLFRSEDKAGASVSMERVFREGQDIEEALRVGSTRSSPEYAERIGKQLEEYYSRGTAKIPHEITNNIDMLLSRGLNVNGVFDRVSIGRNGLSRQRLMAHIEEMNEALKKEKKILRF